MLFYVFTNKTILSNFFFLSLIDLCFLIPEVIVQFLVQLQKLQRLYKYQIRKEKQKRKHIQ